MKKNAVAGGDDPGFVEFAISRRQRHRLQLRAT